jgi:hypothetical protein
MRVRRLEKPQPAEENQQGLAELLLSAPAAGQIGLRVRACRRFPALALQTYAIRTASSPTWPSFLCSQAGPRGAAFREDLIQTHSFLALRIAT